MTQKQTAMSDDFLKQMADVIKVLGNAQRLRIADILDARGETGAGAISELAGLPQAITSQHLGQMRRMGLVSCRRAGNQAFYTLKEPHVSTIINCLRDKYRKMRDTPEA